MAGVVALIAPAPEYADGEAVQFVTEVPHGYRDWKWISSAHEAGNLQQFGRSPGQRCGDQSLSRREASHSRTAQSLLLCIIVMPHPTKNNKIFGQAQSFVPGAPTNIQFMVKDSKKYAATGGWGFGHFGADGKPGDAAFMKSCFPCHEKTKATDLVFTRYAP